MRVLLVHNRYRWPGGEERAVAEIAALLERRGDTVQVLERSSPGAGAVRAAAGLLRGGLEPDEVARAVRHLRADVVHVHNIHPLFGWRALAAAREAGARTVLHLHNFRLFCAISIGYRDGAPCFRCRGRDTLPGLRLRCRGSVPEAAAYAAGLSLQQRHLLELADRLVAVGDAQRRRLVELGAPAGRLMTLPNFVAQHRFAERSTAAEGRYVLVTGRLAEEKGFDTAIRACREAGAPLVVAGDGPDAPRLRALAAGSADVTFTGRVSEEELDRVRRSAAVALLPSRWEEPCPYAVLDAHAAAVPALVGDRGGLPELVEPGAALDPDDPSAWSAALSRLWSNPAERERRGERALARVRREHDEAGYYGRLTELYEG
jgi:glycosyltransferase involved in cell wall biosynthesis